MKTDLQKGSKVYVLKTPQERKELTTKEPGGGAYGNYSPRSFPLNLILFSNK